MKGFNRLFWKIFLINTLVSLGVMLLTAVVLVALADNQHRRSELDVRARLQAQQIVSRLEQGLPVRIKHSRRMPLRIWRAEQQVYGPDAGATPQPPWLHFDLLSASGVTYQVQLDAPPPVSHVGRLMAFLFSLQAVLLLLAALVVSGGVSLLLVRPINQLRGYVARLHRGDGGTIAPLLLHRGDEIGDLAREFDLMARYVADTLQSRQQLLQDLSHELRAPLARLQAAAALTEQQLGEHSPVSQRIELECGRLSRLLDDMLSLARLEHSDANNDPLPVLAIVQQCLADLRFSQPQRPIEVSIDEQAVIGCRGRGEYLERALGNLFGNLIAHTAADCPVRLRVARNRDQCRISICDEGGGVAPDRLEKLFEPFYRASEQRSGFGLGLSICQRAVQQLGAQVWAENVQPHGLCVHIDLPYSALP